MSENEQDDSQKTEEPSQKKIDDARKKGNLITSRELTTFFSFLVITLLAKWPLTYAANNIAHSLHFHLANIANYDDNRTILTMILHLLAKIALAFFLMVLPLIIAPVVSLLLQHGLLYTPEYIKPKLERISPLSGWKRIFSFRSVFEMLKGMLKIAAVGFVIYFTLRPYIPLILHTRHFAVSDIAGTIANMLGRMFMAAAVIMFVLAMIDYLYQRYSYYQKLRMTVQEVKDEYKQTQGNPEIKSKMHNLRMQKAKENMQNSVKNATVIITNPTHYAVALKYDEATMHSPMVVAKGIDDMAMLIKQSAKENKVPIVENPSLARKLYAELRINEHIKEEHYTAVANIINYIMKLQNKL